MHVTICTTVVSFFCLDRDVTRKPWCGTCGLVSASSHSKPTIQTSTASGQCVCGRGHTWDAEPCIASVFEA